MKKTTIDTWEQQWKEFYNESLKGNEARINMLNFTNEHIEAIFSKLNELRMILPHMAEVIHVLHHSLTNDYYDFEYQSTGFEITINKHIQISLEPQCETEAVTEIECKVEFENECLSFLIDEHDHEKLKIEM